MNMFSGSDDFYCDRSCQPRTVYLVYKLWVDPLENRDAHGYSVYTFFVDEDHCRRWVELSQENWDKTKCWSLGERGLPLYRVEKLDKN